MPGLFILSPKQFPCCHIFFPTVRSMHSRVIMFKHKSKHASPKPFNSFSPFLRRRLYSPRSPGRPDLPRSWGCFSLFRASSVLARPEKCSTPPSCLIVAPGLASATFHDSPTFDTIPSTAGRRQFPPILRVFVTNHTGDFYPNQHLSQYRTRIMFHLLTATSLASGNIATVEQPSVN